MISPKTLFGVHAQVSYIYIYKAINKNKRKYKPAQTNLSNKRVSVSDLSVPPPIDHLPTIIPLNIIPKSITNFDDSEVESWQEEDEPDNIQEDSVPCPFPDMDVEQPEALPSLAPIINNNRVSRIITPSGMCPECGDSLMTPMHISYGPCCSPTPITHIVPDIFLLAH
jgi:hypothetical protein